jgi:hypothetical protein
VGIKLSVADTERDGRAPWWWRRRVGMTPFYLGAVAGLTSLMVRTLSPDQTAAVVALVGGAAALAAHGKWGRKKDRAMRNFVWAVTAAFAAFVLAMRNDLIDPGWALVALLAGVFGLGLFWWKDNFNQHRVKIERDMERWPILAKKLSMVQVRRGPMKKTETGRRWMFWWDEGDYTLGAFKGQARGLESALGIPEHRIRFEHVFDSPGMKNPNAIVVTENTDSPILKEPVVFGAPTMRVITDPMFIGPREDNSRHEVTWYHENFGGMHTLAAGSTGSGKSGLYHLVLAESAYCPDLVRWGMDAKGGMALRPWASLFDWMVTDVEADAYWMLTALHSVLKARSEYAASKNWDVWQPDADHPVLLLVVDEAAEVFGIDSFDLNGLSASIARMGRATGVLLLIATQHPTNEAIGSTQLTKNLRRRFCFSVEDDHAQRIIIPKSSGRFEASDIPIGPEFVGTYYSSEGGQICDLSGRVRYVTPHDVYRLVLEIGADNSPVAVSDLDKLSAEAARVASIDEDTGESHYEARRIWTVLDAVPPKGWVGEDADDITGARVEVQAPAPVRPAPPAPPAPDHAPVQNRPLVMAKAAPPAPAGAPPPDPYATDDPEPWTEGDPQMDLHSLTAPRDTAEAEEIERRIAEYAARYAEGNVSPEEADRLLDKMLDEAGPEGIAIQDMRQVLGRSPSWYSEKLRSRLLATPPRVAKVGMRYTRPNRTLVSVGNNGHSA